jgi:LemA protein
MFKKIYKEKVCYLIIGVKFMDIISLIIIIVLVVIVLFLILAYNRFIVLRNRIENAWAQIDVQLKRRYDLIPNLIETVKGYAKHEKNLFTEVTAARTAMMNATSLKEKSKANDMLSGTLKSLFAVAEAYPKLQANENFMMLQEELSGTESKIAYARQAYNDSVLGYNNSTQMFPGSLIAGMFAFKQKEFFKTEETQKGPVKVSF